MRSLFRSQLHHGRMRAGSAPLSARGRERSNQGPRPAGDTGMAGGAVSKRRLPDVIDSARGERDKHPGRQKETAQKKAQPKASPSGSQQMAPRQSSRERRISDLKAQASADGVLIPKLSMPSQQSPRSVGSYGTHSSRDSASLGSDDRDEENPPEPNERTPLLPEQSVEEKEYEMPVDDTVYSFMIVYPEAHRVKTGHYWSCTVCLALVLFILCVCLQVGLTWIAGQDVRRAALDMRRNLLGGRGLGNSSLLVPPQEVPRAVYKSFNSTRRNVSTKTVKIWGYHTEEHCCEGVQCVGTGFTCCGEKPPNVAVSASSRGTKSLCRDNYGDLDCTQPSYGYLDRFEQLDINGDGIWTFEEASEDPHNFGCHLGLSPVEVYRSVRRSISDGKAVAAFSPTIFQKDFKWWEGLVVICSAYDVSLCGSLVKRGVFDNFLGEVLSLDTRHSTSHQDAPGLDHAVEFCQATLAQPFGSCTRVLPVTYLMHSHRVGQQCGSPSYRAGELYTSPLNEQDSMKVVEVKYSTLATFEMVVTFRFRFFVWMILMIWYMTLINEAQQLLDLLNFTVNIPTCEDDPFMFREVMTETFYDASQRMPERFRRSKSGHTPRTLADSPELNLEKDAHTIRIKDISRSMRFMCCVVMFIRFWLWWYMMFVGTIFVLLTQSYMDLLLNAVALAFVFDLPRFIFYVMLPYNLREDVGAVEPITFTAKGMSGRSAWLAPIFRLLSRNYIWGLVVIPLFSFFVIWWHNNDNNLPILEALKCACNQDGDRCVASRRLSRGWFNQHWHDAMAN